MRRPILALILLAAVSSMSSAARADRLVFQRGDAVFLSALDGSAPHRRASVTAGETLWAASRDGRRLAWIKRAPGPPDAGLFSRPAAIYLADTSGRRQKKLFATDGLKDRSGQKIAEVGGGSRLDDWSPLSLGFSADGRTLYVGCARTGGADVELITLAVDASTGAAVVDAEGRWKVLAPIAQADAGESVLAGVGEVAGGSLPDSAFAPLTLMNLEDESVSSVPPTARTGGTKPAYGAALWPALAPGGKRIAFGSLPRGLWLADPTGKFVKRIVTTDAARPRWSVDGKTLYFLAPRPSTGERPRYDLYSLDPNTSGAAPAKILDDVDWFTVVPD